MRERHCFTAESGITHATDYIVDGDRGARPLVVNALCGYREPTSASFKDALMPERSIGCARCWELATQNRNPKPAYEHG
jgi:hypothetical protein